MDSILPPNVFEDFLERYQGAIAAALFIGGLIGIGFGFSLSRIIAALAGWSTVVTVSSVVVAFGVSCGIGLLFGIYPAVQAAKLDPIEAIRYE